MLKRSGRAGAAAILMALGLVPGTAAAQDKVTIAVPTTSLTFSSVFIARDGGFFEKEGLNVEVREIVGVGAVNAVIGGAVEFATPTATTILRAASQGQRLYGIANMVDRPTVELVMRKDVAEAAGITEKSTMEERGRAMKGKTIAIQGVGSVVDVIVRNVARQGGLNPDEDMTISPMGPPAMPPALTGKQLDGYATSIPWTTQAVQDGSAIMLVSGAEGDLPDYEPFAYAVLTTRPEYCKENGEVCRKMVRAFSGAATLIRDEPQKALEILKKTFTMDEKLLAAGWESARKAHADDIRITDEMMRNAQQFDIDAGLLDKAKAMTDFSGMYTDEFIE